MSASYTIAVDPARHLVRITLGGFFTADSIRGFVAERRAAHQRLTCARNQHLTLTDIRAIAIQSQDMVSQFQAVLADPAYRSRRLAFVTAGTLARMQLQRAIGDRADTQVFNDDKEAEAWLFSDGVAAAA